MVTSEKKLDLSIPKTQNTIAVTLARYFSLDEVLQIDLGIVDCAKEHNLKPCNGMKYDITFDDNGHDSFNISCILDTEISPPDYYLLLVMNKGNYHTEIKCSANALNPKYVGLIAAKTANFIQYRGGDDVFYNKKSIINNIAKSVADTIHDVKALIKLRPHMADIYDNKSYVETGFYSEFSEGRYKVSISTNIVGVIRIDYYDEDNWVHHFAHLPNTEMGMNMVMLIIDKATIQVAEEIYIDEEEEDMRTLQ